MASSVAMASENQHSFGISPCARFLSPHISLSSSLSKKYNPFHVYASPKP